MEPRYFLLSDSGILPLTPDFVDPDRPPLNVVKLAAMRGHLVVNKDGQPVSTNFV